ncbi:MAG: cytochrome c oxidase subunit II [Rhodomicrobium sp.]|nr:cytochrome c oxidase subunit II [Rhodomicrobium sp.]
MTLTRSWVKGIQAVISAGALTMLAATGHASEGRAVDWQLGFQPAATDVAEQMHDFHNLLLIIITAITIFVLCLLLWVMIRYNERANPVPSKTSHNTTIEVAWTIVPVLILLVIAVPSFRLLYAQYDAPKADLTIKATGHQWYWSYSYPDHGGFGFDSLLAEETNVDSDKPYLLAVDNDVVVPVNKVVHLLLTSDDVIHNWAMPAFGIKMDAVKGRNSLVWFKANKPGVYYGQCSELCGARHAYMPIAVRVVSDQEFTAWVDQAKQKFASSMPEPADTAAKADDAPKIASASDR